jgi:hypothetical protein
MARRTATVTVSAGGRDQNKQFVLTEMSAADAEDWALRAFLALARSGVQIPDDVEAAGFAGIATMGLKALGGATHADVKPLMDEMFSLCIRRLPNPAEPHVVRGLVDDDTEEVATRLWLRSEVFKLHVDFSKVAGLLSSRKPATDQTEA